MSEPSAVRKIKRKEPWEGFEEHGVVVTRKGDNQHQGICPFCGKEKFFFHPEDLAWDCKVCGTSGGFHDFLQRRIPEYQANFKGDPSLLLAADRGLKPQTLVAIGVGYNPVNETFMIPMNGNHDRKVRDCHRYKIGGKANYATTGGKLQLIAPTVMYNSKRVWVCEGEWDMCAWIEVLKALGIKEDVIAAPGAGTFPQHLATFLEGKDVIIIFDHDLAGRRGSKRTGNLVSGIASSIQYLHWPKDTHLPDEYDIRDLWTGRHKHEGKKVTCTEQDAYCENCTIHKNPEEVYNYVVTRLHDANQEDVEAKDPEGEEAKKKYSGNGLPHVEVFERYRKWLTIDNPEVLDVLYGVAYANRTTIDPLWLFLVAAPGGSKTELLMSISAAAKMVTATSLTGPALISGHNSGAGDPSLIPKLNGKTLIVKDFTTILNMNQMQRDEIFGILRDCYDGKTEKQFGNGIHRKYESKFGILAGVTPAIEGYASMSSVLGERFIKYKIRGSDQDDVIMRAIMNICKETDMRKSLQEIGNEVLARDVKMPDDIPTFTTEIAKKVRGLAILVANMRGVVSKEKYTGQVMFKPVAEIGTRLAKQFMALAIGISIYRQEKAISDHTYKTITNVAVDTAPDRVEELVKQIYQHSIEREDVYHTGEIADWCKFPVQTIRYLLEDLSMLRIVDRTPMDGGKTAWRLSNYFNNLIEETGMYEKPKREPKEDRPQATGNIKVLRRLQ